MYFNCENFLYKQNVKPLSCMFQMQKILGSALAPRSGEEAQVLP